MYKGLLMWCVINH